MHPLGDPSTWAHYPTSQLSSTLQCCLSGLLQITRYQPSAAAAAALAAFLSLCQSSRVASDHCHGRLLIGHAACLDVRLLYHDLSEVSLHGILPPLHAGLPARRLFSYCT